MQMSHATPHGTQCILLSPPYLNALIFRHQGIPRWLIPSLNFLWVSCDHSHGWICTLWKIPELAFNWNTSRVFVKPRVSCPTILPPPCILPHYTSTILLHPSTHPSHITAHNTHHQISAVVAGEDWVSGFSEERFLLVWSCLSEVSRQAI